MRGLGWRVDPEKLAGEPKDWNADVWGITTDAVPDRASSKDLILSVLDQGNQSSCVAHAGFQAIRADHVRGGIQSPPLGSRRFGYYASRAMHSEQHKDEGTYYRTFLDSLRVLGFPSEKHLPYRLEDERGKPAWAIMPSSNAFRMAYDQKGDLEYRRIYEVGDARIDAVKRLIADHRVVMFGALVTHDFVRDVVVDIVMPPGPNDVVAGGHAMVIAGYDLDGFDVVNSWGEDWGDRGWCRFSPEYVSSPQSRDFWVVEHAPPFSDHAG